MGGISPFDEAKGQDAELSADIAYTILMLPFLYFFAEGASSVVSIFLPVPFTKNMSGMGKSLRLAIVSPSAREDR